MTLPENRFRFQVGALRSVAHARARAELLPQAHETLVPGLLEFGDRLARLDEVGEDR